MQDCNDPWAKGAPLGQGHTRCSPSRLERARETALRRQNGSRCAQRLAWNGNGRAACACLLAVAAVLRRWWTDAQWCGCTGQRATACHWCEWAGSQEMKARPVEALWHTVASWVVQRAKCFTGAANTQAALAPTSARRSTTGTWPTVVSASRPVDCAARDGHAKTKKDAATMIWLCMPLGPNGAQSHSRPGIVAAKHRRTQWRPRLRCCCRRWQWARRACSAKRPSVSATYASRYISIPWLYSSDARHIVPSSPSVLHHTQEHSWYRLAKIACLFICAYAPLTRPLLHAVWCVD